MASALMPTALLREAFGPSLGTLGPPPAGSIGVVFLDRVQLFRAGVGACQGVSCRRIHAELKRLAQAAVAFAASRYPVPSLPPFHNLQARRHSPPIAYILSREMIVLSMFLSK